MAPLSAGVVPREDPAKLGAALGIPSWIDPIPFLLAAPAMMGDSVPPNADRTMTLDGPDQVWFLVVAIGCIAAAGLFLMIRIYTKLAIVRSLELADYFLFLTFPLIIVEVAIGYQMVKWGSGVHQWQVTNQQLFEQLHWANIGQLVYCPLSFFVKMAILVQYLRLFAPSRSVNRSMWYGAWATIISCIVLYTVLLFWTAFYCHPREAIWNKLIPDAKCADVNDIILVQGAFNMASDIVILLLPTSGLWALNVPLGRKIAVTVLFATGLLACVASAMRIVFTEKIAPVLAQADVSHNGLYIGLWTEVEVTLGFVVACALCLPKLIQAKGKRLKQAMSKASTPFSTLRSTLSSKSWNNTLNSFTDHTRNDTIKSTTGKTTGHLRHASLEMGPMQQSPPSMGEEFELPREQRYTHLGPPSSSSSMYSQSAGPYSQSQTPITGLSRHNSTKQVPGPINVPLASSSSINDSVLSPTQRQAREEIQTLQQHRFDETNSGMENLAQRRKSIQSRHFYEQ